MGAVAVVGFEVNAIRDAITRLLGLKNVHTEDKAQMAAALALTAHGLDPADALHVSGRPAGAAFASFDQAFVKRAKPAGVARISVAP